MSFADVGCVLCAVFDNSCSWRCGFGRGTDPIPPDCSEKRPTFPKTPIRGLAATRNPRNRWSIVDRVGGWRASSQRDDCVEKSRKLFLARYKLVATGTGAQAVSTKCERKIEGQLPSLGALPLLKSRW